MAHWFSDNWGGQPTHPKLTQLPIGINDRHVPGTHGDRRLLFRIVSAMPRVEDKPLRVLANFHHSKGLGWWDEPASGGRPDRAEAFDAFGGGGGAEDGGAATAAAAGTVEEKGGAEAVAGGGAAARMELDSAALPELVWADKTTPEGCWEAHRDYAFELSPQGNGLDCHRTWEALILNTIPIVRTSSLDPLYEGLPVVVVAEWADVTSARLAAWRTELAPLFDAALRGRLSTEHWVEAVQERQEELRRGRGGAEGTRGEL